MKTATKYILGCYAGWRKNYTDGGPAMKALYKAVGNAFYTEFAENIEMGEIWKTDNVGNEPDDKKANTPEIAYANNNQLFDSIIKRLDKRITTSAKRECASVIKGIKSSTLDEWFETKESYSNLLMGRQHENNTKLPDVMEKLRGKMSGLSELFRVRDDILVESIKDLKDSVGVEGEDFKNMEDIIEKIQDIDHLELAENIRSDIKHNITDADYELLEEINGYYADIIRLKSNLESIKLIMEEIDMYIDSMIRRTVTAENIAEINDEFDKFVKDALI